MTIFAIRNAAGHFYCRGERGYVEGLMSEADHYVDRAVVDSHLNDGDVAVAVYGVAMPADAPDPFAAWQGLTAEERAVVVEEVGELATAARMRGWRRTEHPMRVAAELLRAVGVSFPAKL